MRTLFGSVLVAVLGAAAAAPPEPAGRTPLGDGNHAVGAPFRQDNLAVFPVYAATQEQIGEYTTLEAALAKGTAAVRELGGGQVNRLALHYKGKLPVLVLAGTVVKGGNQDRQIAQDFVVAPGRTVPVDAFCVEHGRWTGTREGKATGGAFEAVGVLAQADVRSAAQYEGDQSKVWEKVGQVNAAASKSAATGTLLATLADKDLGARREALATAAGTHLDGLPDARDVVGIAYAVNGRVVAARWFLNHALFRQHRPTLLATAAMDAVSRRAEPAAAPPAPAGVKGFVEEVQKADVSRREKKAENTNAYRASPQAFGSETSVEKDGRSVPLTVDFTAK